jgi:hypothetical protein
MDGNWVSIQQYSINNNISISTIRRRIKSGAIKSKLVGGKYELFDTNAISSTNSSEKIFSCPALKNMGNQNSKLELLEKENKELKEQIDELKMLLKIIESKSGIKVSI